MPRARSVLNPKLRAFVEALARLAVAEELREEAEAAPQIARLRTVLGLGGDSEGWARRAGGLMKVYYRQAPDALKITLAQRLDGLILAIEALGPRASYRRLALRAVELTAWPKPAPTPGGRRRASTAQDVVTVRS